MEGVTLAVTGTGLVIAGTDALDEKQE